MVHKDKLGGSQFSNPCFRASQFENQRSHKNTLSTTTFTDQIVYESKVKRNVHYLVDEGSNLSKDSLKAKVILPVSISNKSLVEGQELRRCLTNATNFIQTTAPK